MRLALPLVGRMALAVGMMGGGSTVANEDLLPTGALFTAFGDGVMSDGACPGQRNAILLAYEKMSGRILPSERMNMCASGDDFDIGYARLAHAVQTQPTIFMVGSRGANDNIMSTDPAGAPGIALMADWERDIDYASANLGANCRKIICATTIGSLDAGESTYAATVNAAMIAYINAHADSRLVLWDAWALYNHTNCTDLSPASDTPKTHPDDRGARQLAFGDGSNDGLFDVLDALVEAATHAETFAFLSALGTNFDTDVALKGGTTGTKSGTIPPTGNWPTGKRITNNLTDGAAVGVACSIDDATDTDYYEAIAVVSGDPAASNTIVMDDTASISATSSTPGRFYAPVLGFRIDDGAGGAPVGAMTWNLAWSNFGNLGSTTDHSSVLTDGIGRAVDTILVCQPNPTFSSSGPFSANPAFTVRFFNAALTARIKYRRPMLVELFTTARAEPYPLWQAVGESANYVMRLTQTASEVRFEPGRWSGGGLDNNAFVERRIYVGGSATVGTGTLVATLNGSTWTVNKAAAGIDDGENCWGELDVDNGVGGVITARTPTALAINDSTAPTLTSPTDAANGSTAATGSVSTNESTGTLYWVVTESATPPSAAQVKLGQNEAGAAAPASGNQAVSGTGVQNITPSGLVAGTAYYTYFVHRDAAGNDSTVSAADGFTTTSAWTGEPRTGSPLRTDSSTTNSTSFPVTLAPHEAGDTLLVLIVADADPTLSCTGWTLTNTKRSNGTNASCYIFRRDTVAASNAESNPTFTSDQSQQYEAEAYSIPCDALLNVTRSTGITGSSGSPNPDAVTPGGGVDDFLAIAFLGFDNDSSYTVTGYPSTYSGTDWGWNGNTGGVGIGVAHKHITGATSADPEAFTKSGSTEASIYMTVAVWP